MHYFGQLIAGKISATVCKRKKTSASSITHCDARRRVRFGWL